MNKSYSVSFQGYNTEGVLVLSGAGTYPGVSFFDVEQRIKDKIKMSYVEVENININNHGVIEL